ncbi:MAG TPA: YCF48-related protein [Blastocatellia bacterium]|nr:YCF48-related protein [Blastocatellia bacterium]
MTGGTRYARLITVVLLVVYAPSTQAVAQLKPQISGTTAQLRGVSVVSASVAWASGSGGTFLRTTNAGKSWSARTVPGASELDFRDIEAMDAKTAYLLATAGKIYKTTDGGENWALQYNNTAPGVFLDAFAFWDAQHGIALGDPIDGRFLILTTADGGKNWNQVGASSIPPSIEGEAAFAASGTCIQVGGKRNAWFGTGGRAARVFRSTDQGVSWKVSPTPVTSGADSTGIFSIAFRSARHGIVVGGDYKKPDEANANAALTTDGGVTWSPIVSRPGGFRSAVAFVPGTAKLIAVGQKGSDYSTNDGADWKPLSKDGYHSVSFARSGDGWVVGADGRIAKIKSRINDKWQILQVL